MYVVSTDNVECGHLVGTRSIYVQCACRWLHGHVYRALGRRREVAVVTLPTYSEKVLQQPFDELFVPLKFENKRNR